MMEENPRKHLETMHLECCIGPHCMGHGDLKGEDNKNYHLGNVKTQAVARIYKWASPHRPVRGLVYDGVQICPLSDSIMR